ncbi:MAG: aldo/keto reductase [Rhodococcus fascians]
MTTRSDHVSSRLGLGCVNLGSASAGTSWRDQVKLVQQAADYGVVVFDTADAYGSGWSERLLGRALRSRRGDVVISTKGGYVFRPRSAFEQVCRRGAARTTNLRATRTADTGPAASAQAADYQLQDFSVPNLRSAIEHSLRRLGTDYIDVYQLHGPREVSGDVFEELDDLRQRGTIRRWGIGAETIGQADAWVADANVEVLQIPFGILDPFAAGATLDAARSSSTQVWVRGVLGGGILSAASGQLESIAGHPKYRTVVELSELAAGAGIGLDELAVRWVLQQRGIDTVMFGMSSSRHLTRNIELAGRPALPCDLSSAVTELLRRTLPTEDRGA